jgi:trimethylamine:corrinoid methyltransferase-like protein
MVQGIFDEARQMSRAPGAKVQSAEVVHLPEAVVQRALQTATGYELKVILDGYNFPSQICFM